MLAAMGVFGTGTGWPDVIVAAIMGRLGLWAGLHIVQPARGELRHGMSHCRPPSGSCYTAFGPDHHAGQGGQPVLRE
jgi:hypothetical protein